MDTFTDRVHSIVASIPKGKVATYGQVAKLAGRPSAARAVGMIMSRNRDTKKVPCHRVVGATGQLTGYAYGNGTSTKKQKLAREGVRFSGDRVDMMMSKWRPDTHILKAPPSVSVVRVR
jgi:O-6-methylguanine DNA methyltransferase